MSIWCSDQHIGYDDDDRSGGEVRAYAEGWSNHYPTLDVEGPASVDLAHIPVYCVPGHNEEAASRQGGVGPWLRLSINSPNARSWWTKTIDGDPVPAPAYVTVVLDEAAARALRKQLTKWIKHDKAQPKDEA